MAQLRNGHSQRHYLDRQRHPERPDVVAAGAAVVDAEKVWRYMSFSRFVWLLQKKQLWLSRADLLGDPWEISLAGNQLEHVIARHPPAPFPITNVIPATPTQPSHT